MKKYYLYVPDGDAMTCESVVVWLFAGSSRREFAKLCLMEQYAMDTDGFLRQKDEDTLQWLGDHAARLFQGSLLPELHLRCVQMSVSDCYRMTIDGTLEWYCKRYANQRGLLSILWSHDTNFMRKMYRKKMSYSMSCGTRKYLSHSLSNDSLVALLPIALVFGIALVDRLGELLLNLLKF